MSRPLQATLDSLPPAWPESLLPEIRQANQLADQTLVVLDDDPTGTQTVYDTPVLTEWTAESLRREFAARTPLLFLLTNSRSLIAEDADRLAREIGALLSQAARETGRQFSVISRSDSTLRGHFPNELDALAETLGAQNAVRVLVPFFAAGGRYTIEDIHYVAEGDSLIPAAETPFARDASFGYTQSDLKAWTAEKMGGRITPNHVRSVSLAALRTEGPARVASILNDCPSAGVCVVNAVSNRDLEVFVVGLLRAEAAGKEFLFRTAASFVQVRAGLEPLPLLGCESVVNQDSNASQGGLIVVGSYVPKTSSQLLHLLQHAHPSLVHVELEVQTLLDTTSREQAIKEAADKLNQALQENHDVVLSTSRELVKANNPQENLGIGRSVSTALVAIIEQLTVPPRFLIAKGGITSSDVATQSLGVRRALVLGQILPGIPVWQLGNETRFPGLGYVVFPGNVGGPEALSTVYQELSVNP